VHITQGDIRSADPTLIVVRPTVQDRRSFHTSKSRKGILLHETLGFLKQQACSIVYKSLCIKHDVQKLLWVWTLTSTGYFKNKGKKASETGSIYKFMLGEEATHFVDSL
jgi:hypothetical protein